MSKLSIILPLRVTKEREEILNQLSYIYLDSKMPDVIEFIVVDDGSIQKYAFEIELKCKELEISYIYLNTQEKDFSLARARNNGAKNASSNLIMFQDIDMMPYDNYYNDLLNEINIQNILNNKKSFLMISSIYLTQEATNHYKAFNKQFLIDKMIINDSKYIEKFSTGTSLILLNKEHFFNIGAYDENFVNWGHEDIDLNCRLILEDNFVKLPLDFLKDEKNFNNIYQYSGWKSIYRLYGDRTFLKGIVLFHAYHKTESDTDYYLNKKNNKSYFHQKIKIKIIEYKAKNNYIITTESILFDRYKFSLSKENRLKCNSYFHLLLKKIKLKLTWI